MVKEAADGRIAFGAVVSGTRPIYTVGKKPPNTLPYLAPAFQDGKVIYRIDWYKDIGYASAASFANFFGNLITNYPKAFSFNQNSYTATNLDLGLGSKFDSKVLKTEVDTTGNNGANDAKLHVEVVTDYASDNTTDWMAWGSWVQVPKAQTLNLSHYNLGTFAITNKKYGAMPVEVIGTATYKGGMLGLHTSLENNEVKLSHFTGKVTISANFGDASNFGSYGLIINELKLDGQNVSGQIARDNLNLGSVSVNNGAFAVVLNSSHITINGIQYSGHAIYQTTGPKPNNTTQPTGFTGQVKGKTDDGTKKFVAAFGAKKVE